MKTKGFTLIELLIVLALIGILTTVTVLALLSARQKTRDAERVSHASQIRVGLELTFAELASYPSQEGPDLVLGIGGKTLCEVSGAPKFVIDTSECTGTVFMPTVPASPTPKDGKCSSAQNAYRYLAGSGGTDFNVEFCLGKAPARGGLANGSNCITPGGLAPGACR